MLLVFPRWSVFQSMVKILTIKKQELRGRTDNILRATTASYGNRKRGIIHWVESHWATFLPRLKTFLEKSSFPTPLICLACNEPIPNIKMCFTWLLSVQLLPLQWSTSVHEERFPPLFFESEVRKHEELYHSIKFQRLHFILKKSQGG